MSVSSKELARSLASWVKRYGHDFRAANLGISAAKCVRCGLIVTVRAKVFTDSHVWLVQDDIPDWPSPHLLHRAVLSVIPRCGVPIVLDVMDS